MAGRIGSFDSRANAQISLSDAPTVSRVFADLGVHVLGRAILTDEGTTEYGECEGEKDLSWLFGVAAKVPIGILQLGVSQTSTGELVATDTDVLTVKCDWVGTPT